MKYIECDALLQEDFTDMFINSYDANVVFPNIIEATPPADVVPVKHGEWKNTYSEYFFACSECKCTSHPTNYCPNCGARMDGGK